MATTIQTKIMVTVVSMLLLSTVSQAASSFAMQATATCLDCLKSQTSASNGSLNNLLQKVNLYESDLRVPAKDDPAAAATGSITTNREILFHGKRARQGSGAVMISPCHIWTSRHGVFGNEAPESDLDFSVSLAIGSDGKGGPKFTIQAEPIAWGPDNINGNDWAVMHLKNCAGVDKSIGWMEIGEAEEKLSVASSGIQGDKKFGSIWTAKCQLRSESVDHMYLHDCPTKGGSSGNPIYTQSSNGAPVLRALNIGAVVDVDGIQNSYNDKIANVAIDAAWIMKQKNVAEKINASKAWFANKYPNQANPQIALSGNNRTHVAQNDI